MLKVQKGLIIYLINGLELINWNVPVDFWICSRCRYCWMPGQVTHGMQADLAYYSDINRRYKEQSSGLEIGRSEGLALASLDMFTKGDFSGDVSDPFKVNGMIAYLFIISL